MATIARSDFSCLNHCHCVPGAPRRVGALVVEGGVGGAVAEVVGRDGIADVGGGGVGVADAHFEGLGEAAPEDVQIARWRADKWQPCVFP